VWLEKLFYKALRLVAGLFAIVFGMVGTASIFDQVITWLKFAIWKPYTIADALQFWGMSHQYTPGELGIQKLIDDVLSCPVLVGYILLVGVCLFMFGRFDAELGKILLKERLAKREKERAERNDLRKQLMRDPASTAKSKSSI